MPKASRPGWCGVAFLMVLISPGVLAAGAQPSLVIHVDDRAGVPTTEFGPAKAVVERTFEAVGVDILWAEGRFPLSLSTARAAGGSSRHVALMLVDNVETSTRGATGCALGFAAPKSSVAYAFYNRIAEVSLQRPVDLTAVLGRVIAHELGHVLLPPNAHSRYGIMRADLDLGYSNPDRFTEDQARAIRESLLKM